MSDNLNIGYRSNDNVTELALFELTFIGVDFEMYKHYIANGSLIIYFLHECLLLIIVFFYIQMCALKILPSTSSI